MTHAEVREVLARYGPFEENESDFPGLYELMIHFTDPHTDRKFGGEVILLFVKDQYQSASVSIGLERFAAVCVRDQ